MYYIHSFDFRCWRLELLVCVSLASTMAGQISDDPAASRNFSDPAARGIAATDIGAA
jgi:hypothetical protein